MKAKQLKGLVKPAIKFFAALLVYENFVAPAAGKVIVKSKGGALLIFSLFSTLKPRVKFLTVTDSFLPSRKRWNGASADSRACANRTAQSQWNHMSLL